MNKIVSLVLPMFLCAGTVGKVSGRIVDTETGQPLPGANVVITALETGTGADADGDFFILNVPPGTYDVEASMVGYRSEIKQGVIVYADRTTYLNFALQTKIIVIDKPVVVTARRPILEIDMTSKETHITRDDFNILPIEKPQEALVLQGGVTTDEAGDFHVRGGRTGELAYYIDGIEVTNALLGSAPILNKNLVSEMSLLSGTFNAEYGNVMSGVVNIVTPEGGQSVAAHGEYISFAMNASPYRKKDWLHALDTSWHDAHRDTLGNSLYEVQDITQTKNAPFLGELNAYVEGPLPVDKNTRFFIGGNYLNQESYLPFGYELLRSVQGKVTRKCGSNLKLLLDMQYVDDESQGYSHLYKYLYDNYLVDYTTGKRIIVGLNHAPRNSFYYNVRLGYLEDEHETKALGVDEDTIIEPVLDNYSEFYISGFPIFRQRAKAKMYTVKADFNMQCGKIHSFKFGSEHNLYAFNLDSRHQLFPRGPIDYQHYERKPMDGALFLQDKIEHRYLVVNAGLRFDYNIPRTDMWQDIEDPTSTVEEVGPRYQLSPRLGLSHPITDNAMLHFAYGHFFQMPPYEIMYFNGAYIANPESIPRYGLVGNPRILPQRTTAYEVGVKYAVKEIYGIDITLFLKDIENLLATTEVRRFPYDYIIYTNDDFGSVQGFDVTFKRESVSRFDFTINYTYQVARGNRSFAMRGFYDVYSGLPERMKEYYLDFDRRHTLSSTFEFLMSTNGGIGIDLSAASGLPYTPYISEGVVVEENSARRGWEYSLDIMVHQGFKVGPAVLDFFIKGTNITDHLNPRYVYPRTGKPWDSGEEEGGLMGSPDYIIDPANVGPRRIIKAGMRVNL